MTRDTFDMFEQPERGRFGEKEQRQRDKTRVTGASDLIDLTLRLHRDNPLSLTVSDPAKPRSKLISLPKSQIEYRELSPTSVEVTLPEWLATREGLT